MAQKLFIKTHGCQMNEYDSRRIRDLLGASHGMEETSDPAEADLLLLNTCSIREKAEEKVFHELGRWRRLKENRKHLLIGVGGCVASQEGRSILDRAPFVDLVFGPQTLHRLPEMLSRRKAERQPVVDISFPAIEKFDSLPAPGVDGPAAFVSIMEGCSKYCSFCVVPYTRGEEISRPVADVLREVSGLAGAGVREIHLLGQNVNAYRTQLTLDGEELEVDLAELIRLTAAVSGIERIRFTTSHPIEFSDDLIAVYGEVPELVSHLHLPVQSGSDRVLARMKRGYTAIEYKSIIRRLRKIRPDISISSDFIVGFPGESEQDFADTMKLIDEVGFDTSFSFIYSPRPGTPAATLPDATELEVKKQRLEQLQQRIRQQAEQISRRMLDREYVVLVTGPSKRDPGQLQGRTGNNRVVNFRSGEPGLAGNFCRVRITEVLPNSLRGQLVGTSESGHPH